MFEQNYVYGIYVNVKNYTIKEKIHTLDTRLNHFLSYGLKTTIYNAVDEKGYVLFDNKLRKMNKEIYNFLGKSPLKHAVKRAHTFGLNSWVQVNPFKIAERDVEAYTKYLIRDEYNSALIEKSGEQINYFLSTAYEEVGEIVSRTVSEILEDCEADGIILEEAFGYPKISPYDFSEGAYKNFVKFLKEKYNISFFLWPNDVLEGRKYYSHYLEWKNNKVREIMEYLRKSIKESFGNIPISILTQIKLEEDRKFETDLKDITRGRLFDYLLTNFVNEYNLKEMGTILRKIFNIFKETSISIVSVIGYSEKSLDKKYLWDEAIKEALIGGSNGIILFDDENIYRNGAWEKIRILL
ncbi:MAG: family 10 glycosylhydrolase [Nitrososphaeria archaeon]|nr:family 10 glycosylhydrolase [Nitrososphaeria archaeon]